jgi:hypothetical protein
MAFREALSAESIAFEHRSALGCPKPVRDRHKAYGGGQVYTRGFIAHLSGQKAEIEELSRVARTQQAFATVTVSATAALPIAGAPARLPASPHGPAVQRLQT